MSTRGLWFALLLLFAAAPAVAGEVYLNGVKVTGAVRDQKFDKVNIRFDAQGNLHIDAPGIKVETGAAAAPPPAPPVAAGVPGETRYWLVVDVPVTGQYKVLVRANGHPLVDIPSNTPQYVTDITEKLQQGNNSMQVTFLPQPNAPAVPQTDAVSVMIGVGTKAADGTLTINRVLGTTKQKTGRQSAEAFPISFDL